MVTDEELYAHFLCGDDDAIRQLMERYFERLTLFCFTFLHSLAEAEEVALDTFAVIAMKRSTWHGGSFRSWLYRIARNRSISRFRAIRITHAPLEEASMTVSSTETVYLQQEEQEEMMALLNRLPQDERKVLTLLYLNHESYAQAANALGIDEKRIDNLAYRAKRRLREWLRQEEKSHA